MYIYLLQSKTAISDCAVTDYSVYLCNPLSLLNDWVYKWLVLSSVYQWLMVHAQSTMKELQSFPENLLLQSTPAFRSRNVWQLPNIYHRLSIYRHNCAQVHLENIFWNDYAVNTDISHTKKQLQHTCYKAISTMVPLSTLSRMVEDHQFWLVYISLSTD